MIRFFFNFLKVKTLTKACFLLLLCSACQVPLSEDNLKRLNDLESLVATAQYNLSWDDTDLQKRVDSMDRKLNYLKQVVKDSGDIRAAMIRYEAIASNYKTYIERAPALVYDLDKYREEIIKLKEQALASKITNEDFEKRYNELRPSLITINKITEPLAYNAVSIEPEFIRYDKIITEKYRAMGGR